MKVLAQNKRGKFDYQIGDRLVAGLVLSGPEVKSAKLGQVSLKGSYITPRAGELYLTNAHFSPYKAAAVSSEPTRSRKLLLHRSQINQILDAGQQGQRAIPLALLLDHGLVKLEIGLGSGKKKVDKREALKKRQQLREAAREIAK